MSKTVDLQIEKSRMLVEGFMKNIHLLSDKGINEDCLKKMLEDLDELGKASAECDRIRGILAEKTHEMNAVMLRVKESFAQKKRMVKVNYPQEQWLRFGVQDKR